jgi:hypothetical protein
MMVGVSLSTATRLFSKEERAHTGRSDNIKK